MRLDLPLSPPYKGRDERCDTTLCIKILPKSELIILSNFNNLKDNLENDKSF
jgi:hypothetical protein